MALRYTLFWILRRLSRIADGNASPLAAVRFAFAAICLTAWAGTPARGVERVEFVDRRDRPQDVQGEIMVEARDGGLLLLGEDGRMWTIQPEQIRDRQSDDRPLVAVDEAEAARRLLAEMPSGFEIYRTNHYVIGHNTNERYVAWVGSLFERLHRGFYTYWKNQGWQLQPARFPLVGLVFADRESFVQYARPELGDAVNGIIGYYNLETNRITTFNMPNAERNVATIIHEAMHQLAYNSGLQRRFADNPLWVSEGLAVFFEAPDFSTPRGWRTIGRVNTVNLRRFQKFLPSRPADSLTTLIRDDARFRSADTATAAYSEAWALNYFLLKTRRKEYVEYLQQLSRGEPLEQCGPRERLQMFEAAMGTDLASLEKEFLPFITRLR
ncbi:DUF1570 domain-containing protein [Roseimaritima sediminicola]|uniref:DUF1570 domain-containing protein n=1 Tax=Roseimaritima sediminicola TaxID=2662066 RepID=UPI00129839BB|nr:DUF1570 domain-containing protein [Roseimaritima sediminicola]